MGQPLRVLLVEDSEADALLTVAALEACGRDVKWERVDTREGMAAALDRSSFDLAVSDYRMPRLQATEALALWKERSPDSPFLVVSGAIGEEQAVELLKAGARDFFLKDRLSRLCSSVTSALAEAEGRRALRRLQFAIEHTADGFLWVGADGRILSANDAVYRRLGYSRDELARLTISHVAPDIRPETWPDHWQAVRAAGSLVFETRARTKDGTAIPVEVAVSHVVFEGAEYHCSFIRDITDRKRTEAALHESEERYRLLFERNLAGVYRSTLDGRILECNEAFTRMFGYGSREEILNRSAVELYPSPEAREELVARLRSEGAVLNRESQGCRKDGGTITFLENAHLVEGDILEGTVVDITEHRALEERFRQSQKLEAIGRLAGGVAHDFNNLLGVITGYGELMRRQLPEADPARGRLEQILKAAQRAAALTHQLLAFSRKQVLRPRLLQLNSVVSDMRKMLERLIGEDIALVTCLGPGLGNVKADAGQLGQVIMNLAVNARWATR